MDRELLRRVAEEVRDWCAGHGDDGDLDAIIDRVLAQQSVVVHTTDEDGQRETWRAQDEPAAEPPMSFVAEVERIKRDLEAAAHARGVAEERERIRLILLSTAVAEVGSTYDAAWNGALDIAWEKISAAKER